MRDRVAGGAILTVSEWRVKPNGKQNRLSLLWSRLGEESPGNGRKEQPIIMKKCGFVLILVWTLWIRTQTPTSDTWAAAPGLASQAKCQASIKDKLEIWKQFKDAEFGTDSVTFVSNNTTMSYVCLPEAGDPRKAPKPTKPQK